MAVTTWVAEPLSKLAQRMVLALISAPRASIAEGTELSIMSGSELVITCVIHDCPQSPLHVFWYHGDRVVNYDNRYSKVNITNLPPVQQKQMPQQHSWNNAIDSGRPVSRLTIHNANKQHSGSYVCAPIDSTPATVHVHVFHGTFVSVTWALYLLLFLHDGERLSYVWTVTR